MLEVDLKDQVHRYLCLYATGASRAKTGDFLAKQFNTNWRTIAEVIRQLRLDGILIGSSKGNNRADSLLPKKLAGYYIPETEQEANEYFQTFKAEVYDMLHTLNIQKRAKKRIAENRVSSDLFYKTNPSGQKELILTGAR